MSSLGIMQTLTVEAHVPPSGAWFATVLLNSSSLPPLGATVLTIGDLSLVGQVVRADFDDHPGGARVIAVARGGAGWARAVRQAGAYGGGSVRLSTVLHDIAKMAGEPYAVPADVTLGEALTWQAHAPLAPVHLEDVLADLVSRGYLPTWRVEPFTGLTRFDAWPTLGPADAFGRVIGRAGSRGRRTVGLDVTAAPFLPGGSVERVTIARTIFRESAGQLRAEVYDQ